MQISFLAAILALAISTPAPTPSPAPSATATTCVGALQAKVDAIPEDDSMTSDDANALAISFAKCADTDTATTDKVRALRIAYNLVSNTEKVTMNGMLSQEDFEEHRAFFKLLYDEAESYLSRLISIASKDGDSDLLTWAKARKHSVDAFGTTFKFDGTKSS